MYEYLLLFASALGAATLVPFYSEVTLLYLLEDGHHGAALWLVASLGNTLGGAINWLLGRYLLHFQQRSWFPFKQDSLTRAQSWFSKWGVWSLLLAWLPVGGDALTFVAGVMRVPLPLFVALSFTGKSARYAALILLYP